MESGIGKFMRAMTMGGLVIACTAAHAQGTYPSRPIRWINSSTQGGGVDVTARIFVNDLARELGQPVVVDNRAGASGILASDLVHSAQPDGYTLLATAASLVSTAQALKRFSFDARTGLIPVAMLSSQPYLFVTSLSVPVKSVADFISFARANAGKLNYASTGIGSASHLGMELFSYTVKISLTHIPYKSAGPALIDVVSNRTPLVFISSVLSSAPHVKTGKLRALAITSDRRSEAFPEVPTMKESGGGDFLLENWYASFAPPRTPAPILETLNRATRKAGQSRFVQEKLQTEGAEVKDLSVDALYKEYIAEIGRWERFVESTGFKLQE